MTTNSHQYPYMTLPYTLRMAGVEKDAVKVIVQTMAKDGIGESLTREEWIRAYDDYMGKFSILDKNRDGK